MSARILTASISLVLWGCRGSVNPCFEYNVDCPVNLNHNPPDGGTNQQPDAGAPDGGEHSDGGAGTDGGSSGNLGPFLFGCQVFPADNPWNRDVSTDPVDPNSDAYIAHMNPSAFLHPDFGSSPDYGIPFVGVGADQARVPMQFLYVDESDPGPYPFPPDAPVESGSDRHVLVVDRDSCLLYETFNSVYLGDSGWYADSGAIFDLSSNNLRPDGWTSADAAGLPILPGLVRYEEVLAGEIRHALRVTFHTTQSAYIHPATHYASSVTDPSYPPMGLRLRLKASFDVSRYTGMSRVILIALQRYGLLVADNGSDWFITGATNSYWDDNDLRQLRNVPGSAFEVVQTGEIHF